MVRAPYTGGIKHKRYIIIIMIIIIIIQATISILGNYAIVGIVTSSGLTRVHVVHEHQAHK